MGMHSARYMCRRGGIFQVRIPIPKDLHHRFNRKELRWSLQTSDRQLARRRTLRASLAFEEICDTIRLMNELSHSKIKELVRGLFGALVSEHKLTPAIHSFDLDSEEYEQSALVQDMLRDLKEQIETRSYSKGIRTEANRRLITKGIQFDNLGEKTQAGLLEGLTRAKIEYIRYTEHRRKTALDSYYPHDQTFTQETLQSIANVQIPQTLTSQPMPPGEGGSLADRLELYLNEGKWTSKTRNEKIGVLNWFVELIGGDMDVRLIDSSHVIKFKNAMSSIRLHAKTNSSLKQARTTIKEQQIDSKTAKKKFDTAKTFGLSQITHRICYRGQYEKEPVKTV